MKMNKFILLFFTFLIININLWCEIKYPIKMKNDIYVMKLTPREEKFFIDSGIKSIIDLAEYKSRFGTITFYSGLEITTGMGYQHEQVVFDPRNIHYSLIPGLRLSLEKYDFEFSLLHDCFHLIDRERNNSPLWNVLNFSVNNKNFNSENRRNYFKEHPKFGFYFDNQMYFAIWYFPYWDIYDWVQNIHNYSWAWELKTKNSIYQIKNNSLEFRFNSRIYLTKNDNFLNTTSIDLHFINYGEKGNISIFLGKMWDNENINPKGEKIRIGLNIEN